MTDEMGWDAEELASETVTSRKVPSGTVELYVEDHVAEQRHETPVLLIHGWPDSGALWRQQIPALLEAGYRLIVPDQRGFGRSDRPADVSDYAIARSVADMVAILDAFAVPTATWSARWGASVAWQLATSHPGRVTTLVALSVPHPRSPMTLRQAEMGWYQLFFQFEGIAEATIQADDWAWLRWLTRNDGDLERAILDLSRPGALTASLNWYRANLAPRMPGPTRELAKITVPTMGVWSTGDHYLDGERMKLSSDAIDGLWRYEEIAGASHWIPLDAPSELNAMLLDWLTTPSTATTRRQQPPGAVA